MGKVIKPFCWNKKFDPKGLFALAPGLYEEYVQIWL